MFKNIKMSLADLLGKEYIGAVIAANYALGALSLGEASALANEKVDFFPECVQKKNSEMLAEVGKQVVEPMPEVTAGAPTDSFRKAASRDAAPVAARGYYRIGEDGKLYFIGKSEHYHASLGHSFPGYRLIDKARALGIPNATHNNTRGHITRLCEEKLIASVNGIDWDNSAEIGNVIASTEPKVLNRVINLETGSLACEAGLKMMLARFYKLDPTFPAPKYEGKTPVFFIMGDKKGGVEAN